MGALAQALQHHSDEWICFFQYETPALVRHSSARFEAVRERTWARCYFALRPTIEVRASTAQEFFADSRLSAGTAGAFLIPFFEPDSLATPQPVPFLFYRCEEFLEFRGELDAEVPALQHGGERLFQFLQKWVGSEGKAIFDSDARDLTSHHEASRRSEPNHPTSGLDWKESQTEDSVRSMLVDLKELMRKGECYLANASTRVVGPNTCDAHIRMCDFVDEWLRAPSRFGIYVHTSQSTDASNASRTSSEVSFLTPEPAIVCFSPERFISRTGASVRTEPVKGTSLLDAQREDSGVHALWTSQKEMCEQTLVTDLLRNDLNTVCVAGSVSVESPFEVRVAGSLLQMQSVIQGQLENSKMSHAEILHKTLPAGSVTGTPKQAVCRYLRELESTSRGYYTGVFALADSASHFDSALLIRGFFSDGTVWKAGIGAGITTLSDVSAEVKEFSLKWKSFSQRWAGLLGRASGDVLGRAVDAHLHIPWEKWRSHLQPPVSSGEVADEQTTCSLRPDAGLAPVLFLDHVDSFAQNLVAALRERGCPVEQKLSLPDSADEDGFWQRVKEGAYSALVLSPGPGKPEDYPLSQKVLSVWPEERPVLGVCLGHQLLLTSAGCTLELVAENPVHGRNETVEPVLPPLWLKDHPSAEQYIFYNSWAVRCNELMKSAAQWQVTGVNGGWVARCEHVSRPWVGVQFHPESFASLAGKRLIDAFVDLWRSRTLA